MSIIFITNQMGSCSFLLHPKQRQASEAKQGQKKLRKQLSILGQSKDKKEAEITNLKQDIQAIKLKNKDCNQQISRVERQIASQESRNAKLKQQFQAICADKRKHQKEVQLLKIQCNQLQSQVSRKKNIQKVKQDGQKQLQKQLKSLKDQITTTNDQFIKKKQILNQLKTKKTFDNVAVKRQSIQKDEQINQLENEAWRLELQLQKILGDDQPIDSDIYELRNRIMSQVTAASYLVED